MDTKACSKCKEIKLFSEFQKDKSKASGLKSHCKACRSIKTISSLESKTGAGKVGRPRKYPPPIAKPNLKYKSKPEKKRLKEKYTKERNAHKRIIEADKQRIADIEFPYFGNRTLEDLYQDNNTMRKLREEAHSSLRALEKKASELHPIRIYLGSLFSFSGKMQSESFDSQVRARNAIRCEVEAVDFLQQGEVLQAFDVYRRTVGVYPPKYIHDHILPHVVHPHRIYQLGRKFGEKPVPKIKVNINCRYDESDIPPRP